MTGTAAHGTKKGWGSLTGSCSLSHSCPSQGTAVARWSVPSQRRHPAPHTCPTLWHNAQSSSDISENSIPQDHSVTWELIDSLSLQLCGVDFTCPAAHYMQVLEQELQLVLVEVQPLALEQQEQQPQLRSQSQRVCRLALRFDQLERERSSSATY